jgi:hypothetical protein
MHGAGIYTYTLTTAHRRELRASSGFTAVAAAGRPACRVALRAGAALHLSLARSRTAGCPACSPSSYSRQLPECQFPSISGVLTLRRVCARSPTGRELTTPARRSSLRPLPWSCTHSRRWPRARRRRAALCARSPRRSPLRPLACHAGRNHTSKLAMRIFSIRGWEPERTLDRR